ncbi:DUF6263 family protein [candidate division KSB1 bacterium]
MKKKIYLIAVMLILSLTSFNYSSGTNIGIVKKDVVSGKTYELKYDFSKIDKFNIVTNAEIIEELDIQGMLQTTTTNVSGEFGFTVNSVTETGSGKLEMSYDDMSTKMESAQGSMDLDLSLLIGRTVNFTLSPAGEAAGFTGYDKLPAVQSGPGRNLTEEDYINNTKDLFMKFPGKPVTAGETWTVEVNREKPVILASKTVYKVIGEIQKDGINCLEIEGKIKSTVKGELDSPQGPLNLNSIGEGKSVIYYDLKSGRVISTESTSNMEGEIEVSGMILPWTVKSKSESSFVYK